MSALSIVPVPAALYLCRRFSACLAIPDLPSPQDRLCAIRPGLQLANLESLIRQGYHPTVYVSDVSVPGPEKYEAPFG